MIAMVMVMAPDGQAPVTAATARMVSSSGSQRRISAKVPADTTSRKNVTINSRCFLKVFLKSNWAIIAPDNSIASGVFISAIESMAKAILPGIFI